MMLLQAVFTELDLEKFEELPIIAGPEVETDTWAKVRPGCRLPQRLPRYANRSSSPPC